MKFQYPSPKTSTGRTLVLTFVFLLTLSAGGEYKAGPQISDGGDRQVLGPGKPVKREITEGQSHSFRVDLKAGEFIHVVISQLGVNVAVALIGPDGTKVLEADTPRSTQEAEWLSYVANTSGEYRVDIRTVEKGVPAGSYKIEILEQRKSAVADEARLTAQKTFADANSLYQQRNYRGAIDKYQEALRLYRASSRQIEAAVALNCMALATYQIPEIQTAIDRYKEALAIYRETNDLHGVGYTLNELGDAYREINRYDDAISSYGQALQARQKAGYRAGEGSTLYNFGVVYRALGQFDKALEYYEQALTIFREVKARRLEGRALRDLGHTNKSLARYDRAIEYYKQALPISKEVNDRTAVADSLVGLGNTYNAMSRYEEAIESYQQALSIARELKYRGAQSNALVGLSNVYDNLSHYEDSIQFLEEALVLTREGKSRVAEGRILNNLGNTYGNLGQYQKAIDYYGQALAIKREVHDRLSEGNTLGSLGTAYWLMREYQKAIDSYEQALAISREVKDPAGEESALWGLGDVYNSLDQYEKAIDYDKQALAINQRVGDRKARGGMLIGLGDAYRNLTQYERALDCYGQALVISREIKDQADEATSLNRLMRVWEQQKNTAVAIVYGKEAVNVFQEIRGRIRALESRQSYLKTHEDAYRNLANLLISHGRLAEAEKVLELLKEEEFNRIIRRNNSVEPDIGLTKAESEAAKLTDQLAQLASERGSLLEKIANKAATDQDRQRLDLITAAITRANEKIKLVLEEIAKTSTDDLLVTQQSRSMMQTLRKLGTGTVALYTVVTKEKGWVILTTADFRRAYPIDTVNLNQTISDFRLTLMSARQDPVPLAQKLYRVLFLQKNQDGATLAADLKAYRATTLMWSLDGGLRYLPINALHDGKDYLIESYSNLVFTPASLTRLLDATERNWRAFGLGVSKQHKGFTALSYVPAELRAIIREEGVANSSGVLPGVIRLDEQFTRQAMIEGLREGYPVVHIASHFVFIPEREELSYLLLGDGSTLSLQEMQNSPGIFERVELLTLSACETALGSNGKEVEGLAFVAQDLGAKAVVASLWPVADEGTEVLMRTFYRLRQTHPKWSKAEALRQAEIELLKGKNTGARQSTSVSQLKVTEKVSGSESKQAMSSYTRDSKAPFAHPHYWAPFILIGNWK